MAILRAFEDLDPFLQAVVLATLCGIIALSAFRIWQHLHSGPVHKRRVLKRRKVWLIY